MLINKHNATVGVPVCPNPSFSSDPRSAATAPCPTLISRQRFGSSPIIGNLPSSRSVSDGTKTLRQALPSDHGSETAQGQRMKLKPPSRGPWQWSTGLYSIYKGPSSARKSQHQTFPLRVRSGLLMASHLIDCDGPSVCGSSTRTLVTSITDTQADRDTPRRPRALAPLVTSVIRGEDSSGISTPRTNASWASDIEHVYVDDDPRKWSRKLKVSLFRFIYSLSGVGTCSSIGPS